MIISVIQFFVFRIDKIWYDKMSKKQKIDVVSSPSEKDQTCTSALSATPYRRGRGNVSKEDRTVDWTLCCLCQKQTNQQQHQMIFKVFIGKLQTESGFSINWDDAHWIWPIMLNSSNIKWSSSAYRELAERIRLSSQLRWCPLDLTGYFIL